MTRPDFWAVVPVKKFSLAKTRLSTVLTATERRAFARATLIDVLTAVMACDQLSGVMVVTGDPEAVTLAAKAGARILEEPQQNGINLAVATASRLLASEGRCGMISIVSDTPLVSSNEISNVLDAQGLAPAITLVPSLDGTGTNAVACSPADGFQPCYGPGSFAAHLRSARRLGIQPSIVKAAGLALDIDNVADLLVLLDRNPSNQTAIFLKESGIADRLSHNMLSRELQKEHQ